MLKIIQQVCIPVLLLFTGILQAASPLPGQIKTELEDVLYPFANVIPGYQRPAVNAPRLAVADFRVSSDELVIWSKAVSEILKYKIQYIPSVRLYMPGPDLIYLDAQVATSTEKPLLTSHSAFLNLNKALGINSILTGSVTSNGKIYTLTTELVDASNEAETLQKQWQFSAEKLPTTLINISKWVYASLGVELTTKESAYLQDNKTFSHEAIEAFISNYSELQNLKGPLRRDKINQLQKQYPDFVMFAIYALHSRVYAENLDDAYKNLELYKKLRSLHPGNAGVELETYRAMEIGVLPKHNVATRINSMKNLVKENRHDSLIMINLADALVNNGNSLEAISTMLEAVTRWPYNYRTWWSLGWALNQHAWQVRGNSMWRDVPERAKKQFKTLSQLSDLAIDEALALNPRNAKLWNQKISTIGSLNGYSEKLMEVFNKAAQLTPHDRGIYSSALNFATGKWGGNTESRKHIVEQALKNNPEDAWPEAMRKRYADDFDNSDVRLASTKTEQTLKTIIDNPNTLKIVIMLIVMLFGIVFFMGRVSATKDSDPRDRKDGYRN